MTALLALVFLLHAPQVAPSSTCGTWQACRDRALEAAGRQDFEAFHDLAWRAMQAGPRNDPSLMHLVARAQSLSGRPGDALVMLQRLAAIDVVTDAATSEEFASVRRLPRWKELEAQVEAIRASGKASVSPSPSPITASPPPTAPAAVLPAASAAKPPPAAAPAREETRAATLEPATTTATEALRFTAPRFTPGGLAYDAVSRRFIVGHRDARKLSVVDEFSRQIANLATTGFADVTALEIDVHEGTLWVVSAGEPAAGSTAPATALHKLQLISGRALDAFSPPAGSGARFADVVVAPNAGVLVLDAEGRRIYRLDNGARALAPVMTLGDVRPTSIAAAAGAIAYVAHEAGILRVDLTTRGRSQVSAAGSDLDGIEWLRWHRGSLVAVQRSATGHRIVHIRLPRGGANRAQVEILDDDVQSPGRATATIAGNILYVLTRGPGSELVLEKLALPDR